MLQIFDKSPKYTTIQEMMLDTEFQYFIRSSLPGYFLEAEYQNMQNGTVNMAVGKARENYLIVLIHAWLTYRGQAKDLDVSQINALHKYIDAFIFHRQTSIKTKTVRTRGEWGNMKLNWASGVQNGLGFVNTYVPEADLLLTRIIWGGTGSLHYVPAEVQREVFLALGPSGYLCEIKNDNDNKGTPVTSKAGHMLLDDNRSLAFDIRFPEREKVTDGEQRYCRDKVEADFHKFLRPNKLDNTDVEYRQLMWVI